MIKCKNCKYYKPEKIHLSNNRYCWNHYCCVPEVDYSYTDVNGKKHYDTHDCGSYTKNGNNKCKYFKGNFLFKLNKLLR